MVEANSVGGEGVGADVGDRFQPRQGLVSPAVFNRIFAATHAEVSAAGAAGRELSDDQIAAIAGRNARFYGANPVGQPAEQVAAQGAPPPALGSSNPSTPGMSVDPRPGGGQVGVRRAASLGAARQDDIDWSFISKSEGGQRLDGYPVEKGTSGVTIATGVDLGSVDERTLRAWGASDALIAKLRPVLGLKRGTPAFNQLLLNPRKWKAGFKSPIWISNDEADLLDRHAKQRALDEVVELFNTSTGQNFYDLSSAKQTALADVAFQTGTGGLVKTFADKRFWAAVIKDDWPLAASILGTMKSQYVGRRRREATILDDELGLPRPAVVKQTRPARRARAVAAKVNP